MSNDPKTTDPIIEFLADLLAADAEADEEWLDEEDEDADNGSC